MWGQGWTSFWWPRSLSNCRAISMWKSMPCNWKKREMLFHFIEGYPFMSSQVKSVCYQCFLLGRTLPIGFILSHSVKRRGKTNQVCTKLRAGFQNPCISLSGKTFHQKNSGAENRRGNKRLEVTLKFWSPHGLTLKREWRKSHRLEWILICHLKILSMETSWYPYQC